MPVWYLRKILEELELLAEGGGVVPTDFSKIFIRTQGFATLKAGSRGS